MSFTIKKGNDLDLCATCRYGHKIQGAQQSQRVVLCSAHAPGVRIPFPVVDCNKYIGVKELAKWEAEDMGWLLEVKSGQVVGFMSPAAQRKKKEND